MSAVSVQNIYYLLAIIAFVWMAKRYKSSSFLLLLLCVGFEGNKQTDKIIDEYVF